jgi:hypothetical protein
MTAVLERRVVARFDALGHHRPIELGGSRPTCRTHVVTELAILQQSQECGSKSFGCARPHEQALEAVPRDLAVPSDI